MKFPELVVNSWTKIVSDKRILSGVIVGAIAILSAGGYFGYQELAKRWMIPVVEGANFSLEYRKIPFDAKSIDITFSSQLDPSSLTTKNVSFSPFVE